MSGAEQAWLGDSSEESEGAMGRSQERKFTAPKLEISAAAVTFQRYVFVGMLRM